LVFSGQYFLTHKDESRFDFFITRQGQISMVQYETWFRSPRPVQPGDQILEIDQRKFSAAEADRVVNTKSPGSKIRLKVGRESSSFEASSLLKRHSKQSVLTLFVIPLILSVLFFLFALGILLQRGVRRLNREAATVFSVFCYLLSALFLTVFPTFTLGAGFSFSEAIPVLCVLMVHLFLVYPKQKGSRLLRYSGLSLAYVFTGVLVFVPHQLNLPIAGLSFFLALGSLGNTLLTSRDFWARRRARILSLIFLSGFVALMGGFVAFIWEGPYLSIERILGLSLAFPAAFSVVILKSNVFDLERIFRRGLHQVALLGIAVTFAVLLGIGWSSFSEGTQEEWMLWIAIAIAVLLLARPVSHWIETRVHSFIRTKVRYPKVNEIFEASKNLETFLSKFSSHCVSQLGMKSLYFRFFSDPTRPWDSDNEQRWAFKDSQIEQTSDLPSEKAFRISLRRGDIKIGELLFEGDDGLAFDPATSDDWRENSKTFSRCLELICLRDFISLQEGFRAVGRMQALLAHELKNPLAIIKVCAGILETQKNLDEESEEILGTIQSEVARVSRALQRVFDVSGEKELKGKVNLKDLVQDVRDEMQHRFPDKVFVIKFAKEISESLSLWTSRESLKQTLINLIVNAFESGSPWVELSIEQTAMGFSLSVTDQGPGLPKNVDIFKPFVTTKSGGTGLGLSQVKAYVEENRGFLRTSEMLSQAKAPTQERKPNGSRFTLEFPPSIVFNESRP